MAARASGMSSATTVTKDGSKRGRHGRSGPGRGLKSGSAGGKNVDLALGTQGLSVSRNGGTQDLSVSRNGGTQGLSVNRNGSEKGGRGGEGGGKGEEEGR